MSDLLLLANGLVLAMILNQLASLYFFRLDLTDEKRYTMRKPTRDLLQQLDEAVYIEVYLEGDLNAGFRRLRKAAEETLEEFRVYSGNKVHYSFVDPASAMGQNAQREFMTALSEKGIQPMNVIDNKDGQRTEKLVFPGALVSYGSVETGIMLLKGNRAQGSEEVLNQSIEGLEFELANAIKKLSDINRKSVGFVSGHGELDSLQVASLRSSLLESFDVTTVRLDVQNVLSRYDVLVIAKPRFLFSEPDKYRLDQYLLKGGKILLLADRMEASMDSASQQDYFAFPYNLGLDDQLFRYGVRINQDLVQDLVSMRYPVVTGVLNNKPQMTALDWPFFPRINHYADLPFTRNLDAVAMKFVSSIDSVKAAGIRKTPLMFTSAYARKVMAPVRVNINDLRREIKPENFSSGPVVVGYLLEGKFSSLYKNRFLPEGAEQIDFVPDGVESKFIVVADGDLARNDISTRTGRPKALGFDEVSNYTFANQELIANMVAYLSDESGLINARNKEVKIRPLDKEKIRSGKVMWQVINLAGPLMVILLFGLIKVYNRKRKYGSQPSMPKP